MIGFYYLLLYNIYLISIILLKKEKDFCIFHYHNKKYQLNLDENICQHIIFYTNHNKKINFYDSSKIQSFATKKKCSNTKYNFFYLIKKNIRYNNYNDKNNIIKNKITYALLCNKNDIWNLQNLLTILSSSLHNNIYMFILIHIQLI